MPDEPGAERPAVPDPPFAGATGQGVRVAVIDSGVNPRHPHIGRVAGGVCIGPAGVMEREDGILDRLGHGTAVMAAIQEKAPAADYFAVRVFHDALRTSAAALLRAIEWCVAEKMDVVNLSLGTMNPAHRQLFADAAAHACDRGSILVAAQEADGQPCFPGSLAGVLGVGLDWDCPRERYRRGGAGESARFYASGYPRPAPGVPPARNLYGVSFAVANMAGIVARACEHDAENGSAAAHRFQRINDLLERG